MKKVFTTWEKVFATWKRYSQHDVWMLVATCSPQARNMFATNSQHVHHVRGGGRGRNMEKCSQHGKSFRNIGKGVRNIRNTLRNIMIRPLMFS
jgi:hypothetical protein